MQWSVIVHMAKEVADQVRNGKALAKGCANTLFHINEKWFLVLVLGKQGNIVPEYGW